MIFAGLVPVSAQEQPVIKNVFTDLRALHSHGPRTLEANPSEKGAEISGGLLSISMYVENFFENSELIIKVGDKESADNTINEKLIVGKGETDDTSQQLLLKTNNQQRAKINGGHITLNYIIASKKLKEAKYITFIVKGQNGTELLRANYPIKH